MTSPTGTTGRSRSRPPLRTAGTTDSVLLRGRQVQTASSNRNEHNNYARSDSSQRSKAHGGGNSWIRSASTSRILRFHRQDNTNSNRSPASPEAIRQNDGTSATDNDESNDMVVDLLPSFEMYNALHRHIPQGNVDPDRHDFPPSYQEVQTQQNYMLRTGNTDSITVLDATTSSPSVATTPPPSTTNSSTALNLHPLSTQHLNLQHTNNNLNISGNITNNNGHSTSSTSLNIEDDLNDTDNIFIDKLYTLPKLTTPVEIDIRITKHATKPHEKPEEESILKEYTSGDIIHGYCIIENRSTQPLKFEMFYVTLEAYTSVIDRAKGKRTVKRFLRMVDLSASWSYSHMILSSGIDVIPGDVDYDESIIGLNNNRILEPGKKYKKIFMFKLPKQLLDITCKQEQFKHCLLPPSVGIDKYRNNGRYSGIKVNNVLGCGHMGIKGSPILTYDMVDDNLSINYTVDARIVGKDLKSQKLNIMKEQVYNIRVVPFGFSNSVIGEPKPLVQLKNLMSLIQDRLDALERVFQRLEKHEPIHSSDIHGTDIAGTIEDTPNMPSDEILGRKLHQLYITNRMDPSANSSSTGGMDHPKDLKSLLPQEGTVETELNYRIKVKSKSSSNLASGLFSGFLGSQTSLSNMAHPSHSSHSLSPTSSNNAQLTRHSNSEHHDKVGLIVLTSKKPIASLPYWAPSLLRKTNRYEVKNKYDQENWDRLVNTVAAEERQILDKLDIHLKCIQSNNSIAHEPPGIQSVTTELICITAKSDNSIPIKLDADMLMNNDKLQSIKETFKNYQRMIKEHNKRFNENIVELNELYNTQRTFSTARELKFTDFISTQIYNDVKSLANLDTHINHLNEVFKKQVHTLKSNFDGDTISPTASSLTLSPSKLHSTASNKSSGGGFFNGSGLTSTHSKNGTSSKFTKQIVHEWVKSGELQYERDINVNLEYSPDMKETLIPSFESCLCCRFYCIRVAIKFDSHIGTAKIDIPVNVKKMYA